MANKGHENVDYHPGPCIDCNARVVGCHSTCNEYIVWKEDREKKTSWVKKKNFVVSKHDFDEPKHRGRRAR